MRLIPFATQSHERSTKLMAHWTVFLSHQGFHIFDVTKTINKNYIPAACLRGSLTNLLQVITSRVSNFQIAKTWKRKKIELYYASFRRKFGIFFLILDENVSVWLDSSFFCLFKCLLLKMSVCFLVKRRVCCLFVVLSVVSRGNVRWKWGMPFLMRF